jgi:hypothetical protein
MLENMLFNGLLQESMQPVINYGFPAWNQLVHVGKSDLICVAVIGIIVIGGAIFALMCRYE